MELDSKDMLSHLKNFPNQVKKASELGRNIKVAGDVNNIVFCGMGGSGLPGNVLQDYLEISTPFIINKGYSLPGVANKATLSLMSSYSGNTQETVSCLRQALRRKCKVIGIGTGGKLKELCKLNNKPCIGIPKIGEARENLGSLFFPWLNVLHKSGFIKDPSQEIAHTIRALKNPGFRNRAKSLADKLHGKIPIIYSSDRISSVSYVWKIQFNETSKTHAFCNVIPEMNHNEISGYEKLNGNYYVIILEDGEDYRNIKDRISLMKDVISKQGVETTRMLIKGKHLLTRMFSTIYLGWMAAYYLALKNEVDPSLTPLQLAIKGKVR
jgi:glucose/mannose-6-phosphate isomerase